MKGKYLITTDQWFVAPDGIQYKAAWGQVEVLKDDFLGIKTNRISTNWFAKVGSKENHIIIAGCQIHYAVKCENKPNLKEALEWNMDASNYKEELTPSRIYCAE